jgi:hypothetical protein
MEYEKARREVLDVARKMLEKKIHLIEGCRRICSLRHDLDDPENELFIPFRGIDSETDHYPLGEARNQCDANYIKRIDHEIDEYLSVVGEPLAQACKALVNKYLSEANMSNYDGKQFEQIIDIMTGRIYVLYTFLNTLRELNSCLAKEKTVRDRFSNFFYITYKSLYSNFYIEIGKMIDNSNNTIGIANFLKNAGRADLAKRIADNQYFNKIKSWRNKVSAHEDLILVFNNEEFEKYYNENKVNFDEFEKLFRVFEEVLQEISELAPQSPTQMWHTNEIADQIRNLFSDLAKQNG